MKKTVVVVFTLAVLFGLGGCYYDKEEVLYPGTSECQLNARFGANVFPIIQSKCATSPDCHASGSTNSAGPLTSYPLIHNLAAVIHGQVQSGLMPKTGSLTPTERQTILCWIDAGAQDN